VEKLVPTQGCITEHILCAHLQANIWLQDLVAVPTTPDPVTLGWRQLEDGHYVPVVSKVPAVPAAVVELVKCSCVASKYRRRCACKAHNLSCTELCKCEATEDTCSNIAIDDNSSDNSIASDDDDDASDDQESEDLDD
jgi:hypothetical protein